jgi:hypothetical protein
LQNLAETTSEPAISAYKKAILFYANDLDKTW